MFYKKREVLYPQQIIDGKELFGKYLNIFFCFANYKMVGPKLEFIVWLIFSKYSFQKTVSYFPDLKQDFENS